MKYLSIKADKTFGFKTDDIHEIVATDISISEELYDRFFVVQSSGKNLKILNPNGTTFEEVFEEYIIEQLPTEPTQTEILAQTLVSVQMENMDLKSQLETTNQTLAMMMLGGM